MIQEFHNFEEFYNYDRNKKEEVNKEDNERMQNKEKVINAFKETLEQTPIPKTLLLFGSIGRGAPDKNSDIDLMLIFKDSDTNSFINDNLVYSLPFDIKDSRDSNIFDENDAEDLLGGRLNFIRIKGKCQKEDVEFQLFPQKSIKKACNIFGGDLNVGTKKLDDDYSLVEEEQLRPTLTFKGRRVLFDKKPHLAESGKRIDITEIGIKQDKDKEWIRGLTLGKLLAPKILIDDLDFREYLDNKIMRGVIRALLYNLDLYVLDKNKHIIGIKRDALDYRILFNLLKSHKVSNLEDDIFYKFGEKEEKELKRRFEEQITKIIQQCHYSIV